MTTFDVLGTAIAVVVATIALVVGTRLLRRAVDVLPLGPARRATARRWLPAAQLAFAIVVLVLVAVYALGRTHALVVAAAIAVVITGAAWFAIRDLVAGVVLRAEHDLQPGNTMRAGEAAGTIVRVGARSVEVETVDGRRIRVPWARLGAGPLAVSPPSESGGALRFTVTLPRRGGGRDDVARIRAAALHAFFASTRREPLVQLAAEDERSRSYDVTIYAADPAFLPAIEEYVSTHLANA